MATSLSELLDQVRGLTSVSTVDALTAGQAITALGHVSRGLSFLAEADTNATRTTSVRRSLVVQGVACACRRAANQWPTAEGRLPDLTAVAVDLVGRRTPYLDEGDRWMLATELNAIVRSCLDVAIRFSPYAGLLDLARVDRISARFAEVAQLDPPERRRRAILDDPVPSTEVSPNTGPARQATDATAGLVRALETDTRNGALHLYAVLAACGAVESATARAAALAQSLATGRPVAAWGAAPQAWRVLQAALTHFDDGSRYSDAPSSTVIARALEIHQSIEAVWVHARSDSELGGAVTAARYVANHAPVIARYAEAAIQHWAHEARLFARARVLPPSERHVAALVRNQVVIVTPQDVVPVVRAARVAGRLSAALAVELDRSAALVGHQPQRHLAAALAASPIVEQLSRDAAWAGRLAARCQAQTAAPAPLGR